MGSIRCAINLERTRCGKDGVKCVNHPPERTGKHLGAARIRLGACRNLEEHYMAAILQEGVVVSFDNGVAPVVVKEHVLRFIETMYRTDNRIDAVKVTRELFPHLSLLDAKQLCDAIAVRAKLGEYHPNGFFYMCESVGRG